MNPRLVVVKPGERARYRKIIDYEEKRRKGKSSFLPSPSPESRLRNRFRALPTAAEHSGLLLEMVDSLPARGASRRTAQRLNVCRFDLRPSSFLPSFLPYFLRSSLSERSDSPFLAGHPSKTCLLNKMRLKVE